MAIENISMQIRPGKYREPDILALREKGDPRNQDDFWRGADLVVEIVSPDNSERDTRVKREEYAEAGIVEYCIVNPLDETPNSYGHNENGPGITSDARPARL